MQRIMKYKICITLLLLCLFQSCFTGIESTPKITLDGSIVEAKTSFSEEQKYLSTIKNEAFNQWYKGKEFVVADSKISLIFNNANNLSDSIVGSIIKYHKYETSISVAGTTITNLYFTHNYDTLIYSVNATPQEIASRKSFNIPFTIQQSVIKDVTQIMLNNTYYNITPLVYDSIGNTMNIQKFVPIKINAIKAGNHIYPIKVYYTSNNNSYWVYMTIGNEIQSTRNFETLFSLTNPRKKYPHISDNYWNAITKNIVITGMNKEECRLALGIPNQIDRLPSNAGIIELWKFSNGNQLLFEDGLLKEFRR